MQTAPELVESEDVVPQTAISIGREEKLCVLHQANEYIPVGFSRIKMKDSCLLCWIGKVEPVPFCCILVL